MGAYLSEPITKKVSSDEAGKNVAFGASSMQGWRISQEDAHNCCIDFDDNVSLFAVYDGHGGHEVATYCSRNLPDFIKQTEAYKKGDVKQALIDAFLGFDATLDKPEVVSILKELAGTSTTEKEKEEANESDEEENVINLFMEATMPLEEVMAKYQSKSAKNEKCNKRASSASPYLRGRRGREKASSSSGAGCSSFSSSWNTNETDVSSSSQQCGSTLSSTMERKEEECPGNNEAEQVLDSTTSNGTVHTSPPVGSTADIEPVKNVDMPDSSEDVNKKVTSPGRITCGESNANEAELNGAESKRVGDADSSKGAGDNVSSSSCTPIHDVYACLRKKSLTELWFNAGLKRDKNDANNVDESDSEEDEEDEEEEEEEDRDWIVDDKYEYEKFDDEDDEDDDEVEEKEEEEEEEEEEEDDNDNDNLMMDKEEPGYDSGCTAVVAVLKGNELYVANAGDSRCVLCRDGQAVELSLDHKPEDEPEMERIVKAGGKVTIDGRVNGGLNLSRALGDHAYKQNTDLPPEEQMISALPDVRHITIEPEKDEFMVLACDGIWNFMSSQDVVQFIHTRLAQNTDKLSKICEELFDHCLAPDTCGDGTGCDNMTAVIVRFKSQTDTVSNSNTIEVCTAKRSLSPTISAEESNNCVVQEDAMQSCKRLKTETTI